MCRRLKRSRTGRTFQYVALAYIVDGLRTGELSVGPVMLTLAKPRSNVWRTYHRVPLANGKQRSGYPEARQDELSAIFAGRLVRLGSYGDPAAVPVWVWQAVMKQADGGTGYTHQWKDAAPLSWRNGAWRHATVKRIACIRWVPGI
jgi:hypothetical protein